MDGFTNRWQNESNVTETAEIILELATIHMQKIEIFKLTTDSKMSMKKQTTISDVESKWKY